MYVICDLADGEDPTTSCIKSSIPKPSEVVDYAKWENANEAFTHVDNIAADLTGAGLRELKSLCRWEIRAVSTDFVHRVEDHSRQ